MATPYKLPTAPVLADFLSGDPAKRFIETERYNAALRAYESDLSKLRFRMAQDRSKIDVYLAAHPETGVSLSAFRSAFGTRPTHVVLNEFATAHPDVYAAALAESVPFVDSVVNPFTGTYPSNTPTGNGSTAPLIPAGVGENTVGIPAPGDSVAVDNRVTQIAPGLAPASAPEPNVPCTDCAQRSSTVIQHTAEDFGATIAAAEGTPALPGVGGPGTIAAGASSMPTPVTPGAMLLSSLKREYLGVPLWAWGVVALAVLYAVRK